jgi:hypothetical protein
MTGTVATIYMRLVTKLRDMAIGCNFNATRSPNLKPAERNPITIKSDSFINQIVSKLWYAPHRGRGQYFLGKIYRKIKTKL